MDYYVKGYRGTLSHQASGVYGNAVFVDRKMQVRAGTETGGTYIADTFSGIHIGAGFDPHDTHVGVKGTIPGMVANYHMVAPGIIIADLGNPARHGGSHG